MFSFYIRRALSLALMLCAMADLSAQAPSNRGMGLLFDDEAYKETPAKAPLTRSLYDKLPERASLKAYCPEPGDQGRYSTCVGWSSAYAARTILWAQQNNMTDRKQITAHAFSPAFVYRLISTDSNCMRGSKMDDALSLLHSQGVVLYNDFNTQCAPQVPQPLMAKAADFKVEGYNRLFNPEDGDAWKTERVKKSLSEGFPVVIGMNCPFSFQVSKPLWKPVESPVSNYGGHAMCVIGYDDTAYGGAFRIMNSWGKEWADSGFVWVRYKDFAAFTKYGFEMVQHNLPKPGPDNTAYRLSGRLRLFAADGSEMAAAALNPAVPVYALTQSYASGTRFRVYMENAEPAYVYLLAGDSMSREVNVLFPNDAKISPLLDYADNEIAIPDENYYIRMDSHTGTDYLCVLYSRQALDIDALKQQMEKDSGTFSRKIYNALGSKALKKAQCEPGEMKFSALGNAAAVLPVIVAIKHD